jgi:hypothetical protein
MLEWPGILKAVSLIFLKELEGARVSATGDDLCGLTSESEDADPNGNFSVCDRLQKCESVAPGSPALAFSALAATRRSGKKLQVGFKTQAANVL